MPAVTAGTAADVNAFPIDGTVLFKHYFDGETVFDRLKPYYNGSEYRFEVPAAEFDSLSRFLHEHGYDVTIVERPADYYVVVRQYSEHPGGIFKSSVHHESVDGYNCFLMKDQAAVRDALANGAARLTSKPLVLHSESLRDFAATQP